MIITWELVAQAANTISVIAMFIIVLVAGSKGIWVWRRELERRDADIVEVRRREEWWKNLAIRLLDTGDKAVEVAKATVDEVHKTQA